jgi:hypothetical protein
VDPGDPTIKYLGLVIEPNRRLALLKLGDRQRLVATGDTLTPPGEQPGVFRVAEIADDHVVLDTDAGQKRIEKSLPQGPAVTYLSGSPATPHQPRSTNPGIIDPATRARNLGRQLEQPIIPPPGARLMPADRRPSEATGERQ